jgi:hypothetical protein
MHDEEQIEKNKEVFSKSKSEKSQKLRGNHKLRLWIIAALIAIVVALFIFFEKLRIFLAVALIALLAAFGMELTKNDWDLQKLWETKSFEKSKITRTEEGNILYDKFGEITTDSTKGKKADEYNCSDFSTQPEAQRFFLKVGGVANDVNRLDGNKDGEACESLPKGK